MILYLLKYDTLYLLHEDLTAPTWGLGSSYMGRRWLLHGERFFFGRHLVRREPPEACACIKKPKACFFVK